MILTSGMCWRFIKTLVVVVVAVVLRKAIEGWTGAVLPTFITFYPVVMFAALSLGVGAGLLATGASVLMVDYFVVTPGQLGGWNLSEAVGQVLFICLGIAMSLFAHRYRQMQQRMEILVAERTSELERRNAELKESQKKEASERSLMEVVMDALPTGVAITDAKGGTIRFNTIYNHIWGEQRPETASVEEYADYKAWWDDTDRMVLPEEWASARAIRGETVIGQVLRIRRFDGTEAFVINSASPVYDVDGVVSGSVVAIQDVTPLKLIEEKLRINEARLSLAFQAAYAGAWEWNIETNENIWSEELWAVYGIEPHSCEPSYESWLKTIHPDDRDIVEQAVHDAARTGQELAVEWRVQGSDGVDRWLMSRGKPQHGAQGAVIRYIGIVMDISERKRSEEALLEKDRCLEVAYCQLQITNLELQAQRDELQQSSDELARLWEQSQRTEISLRESEKRFRDIVDITADWIWEIDLNGSYTFVSGQVKELLGYEPEELLGRTPFDLMPPDEAKRVRAEFKTVLSRRDMVLDYLNINIHKNGEIRFIQTSGVPIFDTQGELCGYRGLDKDVTERKRAEQSLRQSEERLRFHMENSPMAVIEWDSNFIVTGWTGESELMFGWSAGEVVGRPITDLNMVFEDDLPIVEQTVARLTDGVSRQVVSTNRNYTKNGSVRHCTWYNSVLPDAQGRMQSVMSKVIDITDRIKAEERLDLLSETASLLLLSDSPQDVVESLCCKVMAALDCHLFFNFLVDNEQDRLHLNACSGIPAEERLKIEWLDFGVAVCGCAARDACRIVAEDIANISDPRTELVKSYGVTAYACHPLMAHDRVLGTLSFGSRTKTAFTDDDLSLMKAVTDHVAIAIERMQAAHALYTSHNELEQRVVERTHELAATIKQLKDEISERVRTEERRLEAEQTLREETLQRLQAVEALRRQEHLMIQQNRQAAMGEMIGNIAHQWRQPLNTLGLLTQRLGLFYGSPSFTKELLETSVAKSMEIINYMSGTIDDFRTFFAADRKKMEFRVDEAVSKVLSLVEASFKERRIRLERDEEENVVITGYPNEYAQVLLNILINAKDAMNERNIESPWMKIAVRHENGASLVTIADNAGGISEDIVHKIFDPYFTTKGPQQGTGIGLFMAKSIIETNMGGRLSVRNTGAGAEFRIEV